MKAKPMDITLKQNEIDKAIRRYVSETVGVNLEGKRLGISYSATRGTAGIIASLTIEDITDVVIPGFTDRNADPVINTLTTQELPKLASVTHLPGDLHVAGSITAGAEVTSGANVANSKSSTIGSAIAGASADKATAAVVQEPAVVAEVPEEAVEGAAPASSGLFDAD